MGVQHEIYPAHFPFDLRCQSGILYIYNIIIIMVGSYYYVIQGRIQDFLGEGASQAEMSDVQS